MIRFPAEWEPQAAVILAWPHHTGDFANRLEAVEKSYVCIAQTISQRQKLLIICRDQRHQDRISSMLVNHINLVYLTAPVNDIWVRDTVFLTIEDHDKAVLMNFRFNGWGNKYPHQYDDALNRILLTQPPFINLDCRDIEFVLEGGSVESDGLGTIMTTRQCLLNPNRNPDLSQAAIEHKLLDYLGAHRVIWLDQPNLAGDDTDAHVDTLARFCSADTIAYTSCDDENDTHYASLKHFENQLKTLRDSNNQPYHLVALPMPEPVYDEDGSRLPANYANFLIINGAVMVPVYGDPRDKLALERLERCFPTREIIPTPCRPLIHQYGSLHCMTMQLPKIIYF